jgi:hypothetical protein
MNTATDRSLFRQTVAQVAEKARAVLPTQVNGRIESAARLVLLHDVTPQPDGSILVGSSTDALKVYRLQGTSCTCQDFAHGKAPAGWCSHRIAAGIAKRVQELLATTSIVPAEATAAAHSTPLQPVAPLPEAAASVNVRVTIAGREVQ